MNRLRELLKSPMAFTSNQSDMIVQICKNGYKNFKPCLANCPKSDDIEIMLISLRPLNYICRDHLQ
uniref:Uncharacterized protein n=1 Tax=Romanomermis culicivorax TaxID=13658 RepID=A0A915IP47_ROMCU